MEFDTYSVILAPAVEQELDSILDYYFEKGWEETGKKKIKELLDSIQSLSIFPERGFDADNRFGKKIDPPFQTRGFVLSKDYLVLYRIEDLIVRVSHLLPTRSDYMKLFDND